MTSSMLTGERRWASSRRGGMTVLGKVAVPKPINLPSQRLENHGLDPNVEIVPKGTLSWGSRSSSSASNAWGSSTLSPKTDGSTGSPSHLSGRPSSGGSGTRPSTAGSDRAHEPIANAWGSNSRPSSASGALTSNQTSLTSLRPRSAETRPGSSQLSRFAEPLSENPVTWGTAGTAENLGVTSSKNDGFSLTSGDFPTLGSEKEHSGKNSESQEHSSHGRPGSSSGVAPVKERTGTSVVGDASVNVNVKNGPANSWRKDNSPYADDGARPSVEKWQADPQPYPNVSIPPQHYDAWHGPHVNNHPGGVWYRGPPGGPPYGSPVAPGSFPMEPFPYYRPQIPATAIANPQPVPHPGVGPRGHHPKSGDMFRPHMPDAYIRPGMPIRPGFYPGPVAYEGYYGPPMGYCSSNERDIPFMGMAAAPSAYNRYSGPNAPDPSNSQSRSSGFGPTGKPSASENVESGHSHDNRGPYKVLLKQHDSWDGKDDEQKWEDTVTTNAYPEKGDRSRKSSWQNDGRAVYKKDEEMDMRRSVLGEGASSQTSDNQGCRPAAPVKVKSPEGGANVKAFDDISARKLDPATSTFSEVSAVPKDSSLIQKIEGLNAKARASDGRHDTTTVTEEQKNKLQVGNSNYSANEAIIGSVPIERTNASPASRDGRVSVGDKCLEVTATVGATSRRSTHGMHARVDHRGHGRFSTHEVDGWRKKYPVVDSASMVSSLHYESSAVHIQDHACVEAMEKSGSYRHAKDESESVPPISDASDSNDQRAKMKELAQQRVKQRQKEEEERARDQKAKALAKLEELNRRTQAVECLNQMSETVLSGAIQNKQDESQTSAEPTVIAGKSGALSLDLVSCPNVSAQIGDSSISCVEKCAVLSSELPRPRSAHKECTVAPGHSELLQQDGNNSVATRSDNTTQVYDGNVSKPKRTGHKQKQNIPMEKTSTDKSNSIFISEEPKGYIDGAVNPTESCEVAVNEIASSGDSGLPVNPNVSTDSSVQPRRKNNRSGKNKHKVEEASSMTSLPILVSKETTAVDSSIESGKSKVSEAELDPSSVQSETDLKIACHPAEQQSSLPHEEAHGRLNNQWKSQHSRRMPRNPQPNRSAEKFHGSDAVVWAPVRSQNKTDVPDDTNPKPVAEATLPLVKNDHQTQNNQRNKRAEMERYIPKPVAKEMAQQGTVQQPVASTNKMTSVESLGVAGSGSQGIESSHPTSSATVKGGYPVDSRNGDGRHKLGKVHGSWRQRGSAESTAVQGVQDGQSHASNPGRNGKKSVEHHQPQKPDGSSVKEHLMHYDKWNESDGWNIPDSIDSTATATVPVVKDRVSTSRGKRHSFKGQKGVGNNQDLDHKKPICGDMDKAYVRPSEPEMSQAELPSASKENRGVGERSASHWQPKTQTFSTTNQLGSKPTDGQNAGTEVGRANKKDSTPQGGGVSLQAQQDKDIAKGMSQSHHGHSLSDKSNVEEVSNVAHQNSKKERKMAPAKDRPNSPNLDPGNAAEPALSSHTDFRHEHRTSSGFRKSGNQSSRFGRGHESRGDWNSSGQDNKQHNQHLNRERQRHNMHYEYQPVGPHNNNNNNNNKANNFEQPKDGSHNAGGRFRERGQSHSRRGGGNFYGRQSGPVRVDSSYD